MISGKFRNKYRIQSSRLENWNYSHNGYYFVTICTKEKICCFGEIIDGKMILNDFGKIVRQYWLDIPKHFLFVKLDEFIVMPNHIHGILVIGNNVDANINVGVETRQCLVSTNTNTNKNEKNNRFRNQGKNTISSIIGSYKSICTKTINKMQDKIFFAWQSRFYDHIIRSEITLNKIREYIIINPLKWEFDRNNPSYK